MIEKTFEFHTNNSVFNEMDSRIDTTNAKPQGPHGLNDREKDTPEVPGLEDMEIDEEDHQPELTTQFHNYSKQKTNMIFDNGPNVFQQEVAGKKPTMNPLLANLTLPKNTYLTPLPSLAYERQMDVNAKYVRQGQNNYGAQ
jgi:hypothetical protein